MKARRPGAQAILMKQKRFGYFPQVFVWQGRAHRVVECKEVRTISRWSLFGHSERRYFWVRCADGVCELYQDLLTSTWHIQNPTQDVRCSAGYMGVWGGESCEAGAALV
jgi:hypothetical protein